MEGVRVVMKKVRLRYVNYVWEARHLNMSRVGRGETPEEAYYDLFNMRIKGSRVIERNYVYGQRGL
jgi:hypothetical protein